MKKNIFIITVIILIFTSIYCVNAFVGTDDVKFEFTAKENFSSAQTVIDEINRLGTEFKTFCKENKNDKVRKNAQIIVEQKQKILEDKLKEFPKIEVDKVKLLEDRIFINRDDLKSHIRYLDNEGKEDLKNNEKLQEEYLIYKKILDYVNRVELDYNSGTITVDEALKSLDEIKSKFR